MTKTYTEGRFVLVTAYDSSYEPGYLCSTANEAYCQKHGYEFRRYVFSKEELHSRSSGRYGAWAKVQLLTSILREPDTFSEQDYLVWVDADALVIDHVVELSSFVERSGGADLIIGEDVADTDWLNTGVVLLRATEWSRDLLALWWSEGGSRWHEAEALCWDQSALCALLQRVYGLGMECPWFSYHGGRRQKLIADRIFVIDCGSFNFKYINNSSFVFHAVQNRERLRSDTQNTLSKLQRIQHAVVDGYIRGGQLLQRAPQMATGMTDVNEYLEEALRVWNDSLASKALHLYPLNPWPQTLPEHMFGGVAKKQLPASTWECLCLNWGESRPLIVAFFSPPWDEDLVGSLEHLQESCGEESIIIKSQCQPNDSHRVKLWQLVEYCVGRPPPIVPALCSLNQSTLFSCMCWKPSQDLSVEGVLSNAQLSVDIEPPGNFVPLHFVPNTLRLAQVTGSREYLLVCPHADAFHDPVTNNDVKLSDVDVLPMLQHVSPCSAIVSCREAIFLPAGCWVSHLALQASIVWIEEVLSDRQSVKASSLRVT